MKQATAAGPLFRGPASFRSSRCSAGSCSPREGEATGLTDRTEPTGLATALSIGSTGRGELQASSFFRRRAILIDPARRSKGTLSMKYRPVIRIPLETKAAVA